MSDEPRWYSVNTIGMATLCRGEADARREAADADAMWPRHAPHVATQLVPMAEIDRLRARVALLEPVAAAARIYYRHYMQDEADDVGEQWCGLDQHERAKAVRDSLHDLEPFTVKELRL